MLSVPHPLQSAALAAPQGICLQTDEGCWSAAALRDAVASTAAAMQQAWGLKPTDKVALHGAPSAAWLRAFHAASWLGATVLPLPPAVGSTELRAALRLASEVGCRLVISTDLHKGKTDWAPLQLCSLSSLAPHAESLAERYWPLDETRLIMLSSGTTAAPKAIALSTAQLVFNAFGSAMRLGCLPQERWLAALPLHHMGGLSIALRCLWSSGTMVLHPNFDAQRVAQSLDAGEVALVSMVPQMLERVLAQRPVRPFPAALRVILLGGAAPPDALLRRCVSMRLPVAVSYGMTEAASQVATTFPGAWQGPGDCGPPLACTRVSAPQGQFYVEGPTVAEGGVYTADCGRVDDDGRVYVSHRSDDVIISGGENIAPQQIEAVLLLHPAVAQAAVVGRPDATWGTRPVAYLVPHADVVEPSAEAMAQFCGARLAKFKVPDAFVWCRGLPRTALGKLQRRKLLTCPPKSLDEQDSAGQGPQAEPPQACDEVLGHSHGLHRFGIHKNIHQAQSGAQCAIDAADGISIGDGANAQALDAECHQAALTEADGVAVVGLTMDHGAKPEATAERLLQGQVKHLREHFFERVVAIPVVGTEENDAAPVDVIQTRSNRMDKRHG